MFLFCAETRAVGKRFVAARAAAMDGGSRPAPFAPFRSGFALIGSSLLVVGPFVPVFSVPLLGSWNLFRGGGGDGVLLIAIGLAAIGLTIFDKFDALKWPGFLSAALIIYELVDYRSRLSGLQSIADSNNGEVKAISRTVLSLIHLEWGWAVIIPGSVLLIAAGFKQDQSPKT